MTEAKAQGVDISTWQDNNSTPQMFDPQKARAMGASFVGIKVSQAGWADPDYAQNWAHCKPYLYRLPYHFLTWDVAPQRQAETFWSLIERDTFGLLPLTCDFEWWQTIPADAMDKLYNFDYRLKQLCDPLPRGVYSALEFWKYYGSKADYWKQLYLWLCDVNGPVEVPAPWTTHTFHQYTFKLPGPVWGAESLDLDGDTYNGTLEQMIDHFQLPDIGLGAGTVVEPQPALPQMRVIANGLTVRAGPGKNFDVLTSYPKGKIIEVQATSTWVKTDRGWCCQNNLDGTYLAKI